jgi:hypothetical protein
VFVPFALRTDPAPVLVSANLTAEAELVLALDPAKPVRLVAGLGALPAFDRVEPALAAAAPALHVGDAPAADRRRIARVGRSGPQARPREGTPN